MDMERQISQFYLQKPAGFRGGDPLAGALSRVASGVVSGIEGADAMKTAALNRELSEAREARAVENQERAKELQRQADEDRETAKKENEDAKREEKRAKMTPEKAPATANAISQYLSEQPEFAGLSPDDVIEASIVAAKKGETVISIQDKLEKQRQAAVKAAASERTSTASETRAEVARTGGPPGSGKQESEASIKNRGEAEAQELIGTWETETGEPITLDDVEFMRDDLEASLANITDEVERKKVRAMIAYYNQLMLQTDLGRTAGPRSALSQRGKL